MAAAEYLVDEGLTTALVVGSSQLTDTMTGAGVSIDASRSPDAVVVGLDIEATYETIANASAAIRGGSRFVATNTDVTLPTPNGLVPGAGSLVAAITAASGAAPVVCGKPHAPMTRLIDRRLKSDNVWMVGDRPETDIALARAAGWRSVLALSGVTSASDTVPPALTPDYMIESIAVLRNVLSDNVEARQNEG
jgi:4-nitrophenyl phosphatase